MTRKENQLLQKRDELLRENNKLKQTLRSVEDQFSKLLYPFYFPGKIQECTLTSEAVDMLVEKSYLTPDLKPTKLSLSKDFIRCNDGSLHFKSLDNEPELLLTSKFMLHLANSGCKY